MTNRTLPDEREGEVCIRGYSVMAGIYKHERDDTFDADGWYHTGDRGYFKDGYLFFTGRATEMIKTAGSPTSRPARSRWCSSRSRGRLAVVHGIPDDERGQLVVAVISPEAGVTLDLDDVLAVTARPTCRRTRCRATYRRLGDPDMPFLASGKLDRRTVYQKLEDAVRRTGLLHNQPFVSLILGGIAARMPRRTPRCQHSESSSRSSTPTTTCTRRRRR